MKLDKVRMLDIEGPFKARVEVLIRSDGEVLWVNIDGECVLHICKINPAAAPIIISDDRNK